MFKFKVINFFNTLIVENLIKLIVKHNVSRETIALLLFVIFYEMIFTHKIEW